MCAYLKLAADCPAGQIKIAQSMMRYFYTRCTLINF